MKDELSRQLSVYLAQLGMWILGCSGSSSNLIVAPSAKLKSGLCHFN